MCLDLKGWNMQCLLRVLCCVPDKLLSFPFCVDLQNWLDKDFCALQLNRQLQTQASIQMAHCRRGGMPSEYYWWQSNVNILLKTPIKKSSFLWSLLSLRWKNNLTFLVMLKVESEQFDLMNQTTIFSSRPDQWSIIHVLCLNLKIYRDKV